jgi:hypothetical protein
MRRIAAVFLAAAAVFAAQANEPPPPDAVSEAAPPQSAGALLKSLPGVIVSYDSEDVNPSGINTITGLVISLKKPDGSADPDNTITIARAEAAGLDAGAIDRIFNADRYSGAPDEAFRRLAERITLSGISLTAYGKTVMTLAESVTNGWEMKPFGFKPGGPNFLSQFRSPELAFVQIYGHVLDSSRFGPSSAKDLHVEFDMAAMMQAVAPNAPGTPAAAGHFIYDVGEMEQGAIDRGRIERVTFRNMKSRSAQPPLGETTLTVREGWVEGVDLAKVVPAMMAAELPPISREPLVTVGRSCNYDYAYQITGIGVAAIPEVCMEGIPFVWILPTHFDIDIKGVFTPAPPGETIMPAYASKYFERPLDFSIRLEASYDADSGVAAFDHYALRLAGFGSVDFKIAGGGLQLDTLMQLPATYLQTLSLVSGELELIDEGGVAKILDMAAAAQSEAAGAGGAAVTPDALKMQAVLGVNMMVGMLGNTPDAAAMGESIRNFLDKGGKLSVGVKPAKPLVSSDFVALAGKPPAEMAGTLGAYATWTAP